jgi:hypothetical protein
MGNQDVDINSVFPTNNQRPLGARRPLVISVLQFFFLLGAAGALILSLAVLFNGGMFALDEAWGPKNLIVGIVGLALVAGMLIVVRGMNQRKRWSLYLAVAIVIVLEIENAVVQGFSTSDLAVSAVILYFLYKNRSYFTEEPSSSSTGSTLA